MYRRYIGELENDFSKQHQEQLLKNQKDVKSLQMKAGVYEGVSDRLNAKLIFANENANCVEAKLEYMMSQNHCLHQDIEKL